MSLLRRGGVLAVFVLVTLGGLGCVDILLSLQSRRCRVAPLPLDLLPSEVSLRARMRVKVAGEDVGFDVIAERAGGPLQLVGLATTGTRLFALTQNDETILFGEGTEGATRSLATMTLDSLRRGVWINEAIGDGLIEGGSFRYADEWVREGSLAGVRSREFFFLEGDPTAADLNAPNVSIDYRPNPALEGDSRFEIRNSSCGYEAVVVLLESSL